MVDPSDQVVQQAAFGLGSMRDPATLSVLVLAACSKRPGVSAAACNGLQKLQGEAAPAVPALLGIFRDPSNLSGGWAIIALGRIGPAAHEAVPDLIARLGSPTARQRSRSESAIALGRIGVATPEVIAALVDGLQDQTSIRRGCVEALYRLGWKPEGADRSQIEAMLTGTDEAGKVWARMLLAQADGRLDAEVDRLIILLNGQPWYVSEAAIEALESLGPRAQRALLALRMLQPEPSKRVPDSDTQLKWQAAEPAIRRISGEK
jgi:HEAT repeat protein